MDVHKESIEIALADDGAQGEVRRYGRIGGTLDALKKTLRKLVSKNKTLHFCYEAGPCGYELYRYLTDAGHVCIVVAPSLIPKKPGDKVKTDKRDAVQLVRLFRAGELTPVYVPDREDEAIRDLSRAREDAMIIQKSARQRLKSFLLRQIFVIKAGPIGVKNTCVGWRMKCACLFQPNKWCFRNTSIPSPRRPVGWSVWWVRSTTMQKPGDSIRWFRH